MRILARFIIFCVLAAIIGPFSSRGADTDAQMKAREALRQKMSELEVPAVVTNAPTPAASSKAPKTKAKPAPAPKPVVTQPAAAPSETVRTAPAPTPAPAPARTVEQPSAPAPAPFVKTNPVKQPPVARTTPASGQMTASRPDSDRIAKAREAMEAKMKELNTQGGEATVASQPAAVSPPPANRPAATQPTVAKQRPPATTSTRAPEISSTSRPITSSETSEPLPAPPPRKRAPEPESKQPKKSKKPRESRPTPESRPMYALPQGPPPPVSAEKLAKLNALLQQYDADRITPEQYHQERAKILAGP